MYGQKLVLMVDSIQKRCNNQVCMPDKMATITSYKRIHFSSVYTALDLPCFHIR